MELNYKDDFQKSCEIIENPYLFDKNVYSSHARIFNMPTVNHKELFRKMNVKGGKYLGVMASTYPMLQAICCDCKDITVFDVNHLNGYFMYLFIGAILALEYEEFLHFFLPTKQEDIYDIYYFYKCKEELPADVQNYWQALYTKYNKDQYKKIFFYNDLKDNNYTFMRKVCLHTHSFLVREGFYTLKRQLKRIHLTYRIADFKDIPQMLNKQKFAVIYLSVMQNLIYDNVHGYNYMQKLQEYEKLLAEGGVLEGAYYYWYWLEDNKKWYEFYIKELEINGYVREKINIVDGEDLGSYNLVMLKRKK